MTVFHKIAPLSEVIFNSANLLISKGTCGIPLHNTASAPPQNQLHLAECTCRKRCMVGCGVLCGAGI